MRVYFKGGPLDGQSKIMPGDMLSYIHFERTEVKVTSLIDPKADAIVADLTVRHLYLRDFDGRDFTHQED